jgi:nucleoside triphosphate diphosphatase
MSAPVKPATSVDELLAVMARLRGENGCPWDREQDFSTIAPYTIEEAYEVADAIARHDSAALRDELGDLLFQVVFHAQMAQEAGEFAFADVVRAICDKMYRRHPHVFADATVTDARAQAQAWEEQKARERAAAGQGGGALDGIPGGLAALMRAAKLGKRAARTGFDWPDWRGAREKIDEELRELDREIAARADAARIREEIGDLLFAVVNLARHLDVDAEAALQASNGKFARRFQHMEQAARGKGLRLEDLDPTQLDQLWNEAKAGLAHAGDGGSP